MSENVIMRKCPQCGSIIVKKIAWDIEVCENPICRWIWNVKEELEENEKNIKRIQET